jgi:hypothetical protein
VRAGRGHDRRRDGVHQPRGRPALMRAALLLALALALAACGDQRGKDCTKACEHMVELSVADLDLLVGDDPDLRDFSAQAKEGLQRPAAPGRDTCVQKCREGKLDAPCVLRAKTMDDAMRCGKPSAPR